MLGPRLEKIMMTHESKADFAKVDIDQLSDLAFKYNVSILHYRSMISEAIWNCKTNFIVNDFKVNSVPTVMAFKNGKQVGQFVGLLDENRIKKFVQDAIDK